MKIAWFTPFARHGSGIAVFSGSVVGELAQGHQVVVYAPDVDDPRHGVVRDDVPIICLRHSEPARLLKELKAFDHVFYNLGDNITYHREIFDTLRAHPGLVVLHDLVMRDFFAGYHLAGGRTDVDGLLERVADCHGEPGRAWMRGILEGRVDPANDPHLLEFHMAEPAVRSSLGVVVHSEFARRRVSEATKIPVARVDFPAPPLAEAALDWDSPPDGPEGEPVRILTFGHVNPNKQVHLVIEAIGSSDLLRSSVRYTVIGNIGDPGYKARLEGLVADLELGSVVDLAGAKTDEILHEAIRGADLVVNLRNPHYGESSWSLLETLFGARPTIVWDHGYYGEFPDEVVRKISDLGGLVLALEDLCSDRPARRSLGDSGRSHAVEHFDTPKYCREILAFAESSAGDRVVLGTADRLARLIAEMTEGPGAGPLLNRLTGEFLRLLDDRPPKARLCRTEPSKRR